MKQTRILLPVLLAITISAIALPIAGLKARAESGSYTPAAPGAKAFPKDFPAQKLQRRSGGILDREPIMVGGPESIGPLNPTAMKTLGFKENPGPRKKGHFPKSKMDSGGFQIQSGQPAILNARSALSAAVMTNIGGRDTQFSEVTLIADWDGREDCAADREVKVDDFSSIESEIDFTMTRVAVSEHTIANGFNENIFYYGDSLGNVYVGADNDGNGRVDLVQQINIPTTLGPSFPLDDQITITGLAVNPAADFAGTATAGEILWGTFTDSEGFRQGSGTTVFRGGLFFILLEDTPSLGFPVTITGPGPLRSRAVQV